MERGERAISASACKTSGPKTRSQMEVSYKIKSTIASEEWWEIANAANCATIARAENTDGPILMCSRQRFSDMYGQGWQRKVVCFPCSLSSHSLNVVCFLVTSRERCQWKVCLSWCSLYPGEQSQGRTLTVLNHAHTH